MSVKIYLRLDDVQGAVKSSPHKGWIEILSWQWSLARGQAQSGGKTVTVTQGYEISLLKVAGIESADLMRLCATGAVTATGAISTTPEVSKREVAQKYVAMAFGDIVVRSVNCTAEAEDNFVREKVVLRFNTVNFDFHAPPNADSGAVQTEAARHSFSWAHKAT